VSSTYDGNDVYPTSITIPDDSDAPKMAAFNPALEAVADRTKSLLLHSPREASIEYLTSGAFSFTVPARVTVVRCKFFGGGGGGAGGNNGVVGANNSAPGGGGGAGAQTRELLIVCVPGDVITGTIGAGGTGGTATAAGSDGADTIVYLNGVEVGRAVGGLGGSAGSNVTTSPTTNWGFAPGGSGPRVNGAGGDRKPGGFVATSRSPILPRSLGSGGAGMTYDASLRSYSGAPSLEGGGGGTEGNPGIISGTNYGGGGGGGGGGGPAGAGGNGSAGGSGNNAGAGGTASNTGSSAAANTGAGGGGGGGGGAGSSTAGGAGTGGWDGGSGKATLLYTTDSP
jgi:hypothetical protein